jgi:tetraacyldisaccharide 4'-kinase
MKIFKPKFWHNKNSIISFFLLPLSILFQTFTILKKTFSEKNKFSINVVCVGNIYLGGTGKTPLCIELSKILEKLNKKNVIVKKSYKAHEDEFKLIESKKIKLFKCRSRSRAIEKAQIEGYDCVILDDGLQDPSISKDLNIVCFNEEQLAGNEMVIPSGPLREPLSALKNYKIVVINGNTNTDFEKKIKFISEGISIYYSEYLPDNNLDQFKEKELLAFAGIGNPGNFFNLLKKNNLKIKKSISFPDHYNYSLKELNNLVKYSTENNLKLITTEKDYFRIKHFNIPEIQYLGVTLKIKNKDQFEKKIIECLF